MSENANQTQTPNPAPNPAPTPAPDASGSLRAQNAQLNDQIKQLQTQLDGLQSKGLEDSKQWETLAKQRADKIKELETQLTNTNKSILDRDRFSAVKDACLKAGLRPDAVQDLDIVDLSPVQVEATNKGRTIVHGADDFAAKLKAARPYWFSDAPPNVNTSAPRLGPDGALKKISLDDVKAAEAEYKKSGSRESMQRYQNTVLEFNKQKRLA